MGSRSLPRSAVCQALLTGIFPACGVVVEIDCTLMIAQQQLALCSSKVSGNQEGLPETHSLAPARCAHPHLAYLGRWREEGRGIGKKSGQVMEEMPSLVGGFYGYGLESAQMGALYWSCNVLLPSLSSHILGLFPCLLC